MHTYSIQYIHYRSSLDEGEKIEGVHMTVRYRYGYRHGHRREGEGCLVVCNAL